PAPLSAKAASGLRPGPAPGWCALSLPARHGAGRRGARHPLRPPGYRTDHATGRSAGHGRGRGMKPALRKRLQQSVDEGRAAPLELALADWALRHGGSEAVAIALASCARAVADGHSCLDLTQE